MAKRLRDGAFVAQVKRSREGVCEFKIGWPMCVL